MILMFLGLLIQFAIPRKFLLINNIPNFLPKIVQLLQRSINIMPITYPFLLTLPIQMCRHMSISISISIKINL